MYSRTDTGIALQGKLTADTVTEVYNQSPGFGSKELDVDLSEVIEMDSAGLALLVYWRQQAESKQCHLRLINSPEQVKTMIRISDLDTLLE